MSDSESQPIEESSKNLSESTPQSEQPAQILSEAPQPDSPSEESKAQDDDSSGPSGAQKGSRHDLFKAKKRPEEPRPPQRLFAPPNPEEREQKRLEYLSSTFEDEKKQLCRFWLRGLCMFPAANCKYAHGISDLIFTAYNNEIIDYDGKPKDYNQKALWIEAKPSYTNIYDYQFEITPPPTTIHTQHEIDTDRVVRAGIRSICQSNSMVEFYRLLQKTYPAETAFTEAFIEREFNRVGFNKIGFKLKTQYIVSALSHIAFEARIFIPAGSKKPTTVLLEYPSNIRDAFQSKFLTICRRDAKEDGFPLMESSIRKQIYSETLSNEPALHQIMSVLKLTFREYLDSQEANPEFIAAVQENLPDDKRVIDSMKLFSYDTEMEKVKEKALVLLNAKKKSIQNLTAIEEILMKEFETNVKAFGSYSKFRQFLRAFLMTQKVYTIRTQVNDFAIKPNFNPPKQLPPVNTCDCPLIPALDYPNNPTNLSITEELKLKYTDSRIVLVDSEEPLRYANSIIRSHEVVGVDLEGALRVNGYVELVQISVQKDKLNAQIFVFDVHQAENLNEDRTFYLQMKQTLQAIMQDSKIRKIFHDSRNDSLALHRFLDACPKNVFDTAAILAFKFQIEKYIGIAKDDTKVLRLIDEQRQPGLNEVLLTFNAAHGINEQKDEMHKKFKELPIAHFLQRPIREDYLEYAARDVEDLIGVHHEMITALKDTCKKAFPSVNETVVIQWLNRISKSYTVYGKNSIR